MCILFILPFSTVNTNALDYTEIEYLENGCYIITIIQ